MWVNISGAGADPHPFWILWSLSYTLSSGTLPLNVRIIWSDLFSDCSSFYVVYICNNYRRMNQNRRLMMGLTNHLSCISVAFSSYHVFIYLLELPSFNELDLFDDDSDNDGSGSGSPGMCAFFSWNSVGRVSGVCYGIFVPTGIESIGDIVLLVVLVPKGVNFKVGGLVGSYRRPKSWISLLVSKSLLES